MASWLFKSEPKTWSWEDQLKAPQQTTCWDGVRNYQARNNMMHMKKGDLGLFYHSVKDKLCVGLVKVVREHYPDHSAAGDDRWEMVDIKAVKTLKRPVSLAEIKEHPALENMALLRQGRLSVSPVTEKEFKVLLQLAQTTL